MVPFIYVHFSSFHMLCSNNRYDDKSREYHTTIVAQFASFLLNLYKCRIQTSGDTILGVYYQR